MPSLQSFAEPHYAKQKYKLQVVPEEFRLPFQKPHINRPRFHSVFSDSMQASFVHIDDKAQRHTWTA